MEKEVNKWVVPSDGSVWDEVIGTSGRLTVNGVELTEWAKRIEALEKEVELLKSKK